MEKPGNRIHKRRRESMRTSGFSGKIVEKCNQLGVRDVKNLW
jgi:hypothetical protein